MKLVRRFSISKPFIKFSRLVQAKEVGVLDLILGWVEVAAECLLFVLAQAIEVGGPEGLEVGAPDLTLAGGWPLNVFS